jgi:hypothetical protein
VTEAYRYGLLLRLHEHRGVKIPEHMHDGLVRYLVDRVLPGSFLHAVLCNDLFEAAQRADLENTGALASWVFWLREHAPPESYGDPGRVFCWLARK